MKFRKKPVVIDAVQWTGENALEVLDFGIAHGARLQRVIDALEPTFVLVTIHGDMALARPGDWIIPEPAEGRFYPCKPDVFAASYDRVIEAHVTIVAAATKRDAQRWADRQGLRPSPDLKLLGWNGGAGRGLNCDRLVIVGDAPPDVKLGLQLSLRDGGVLEEVSL